METNKIYTGNNIDVLRTFPDNSIDSVVTDPPYGISFMNKHWDYDVPSVETWKEVLRVLKPGGYALVACGTRTQHRMAVNLEDAGFEIRDLIAWIYGSGFPKSLDISKAIDKSMDAERETIGKGRSGKSSHAFQSEDTTTAGEYRLTAPSTDEAKQWQGWGTALKPAMELWTLCRKPFKETVAANVLEYGTGGLNIDGCRIGTEERTYDLTMTAGNFETTNGGKNVKSAEITVNGRFPANVIHDGSDEVVALFPSTNAGGSLNKEYSGTGNIYGKYGDKAPFESYGDEGSAARFFYTAKASQGERNMGLYAFEEERHADRNIADGVGGDNPRNRTNIPKKNFHPTVKPVDLMQYLVRLVTPKGGICVDPYLGSGTTAIACKLEGMQYIGIELEEEYAEIARARIAECDKDYKTKEETLKADGVAEVFDIFDFIEGDRDGTTTVDV